MIYLSHRHYLNEVSVEGKKNIRFLRHLGYWDRYLFQIIRTGNCISLLSTPFTITEESFWNINHFEDLAKYVFWTFNKSFLLKILDRVESQRLPVLLRCRELLAEYPQLTHLDVMAAIAYGAEMSRERILPIPLGA